MKFLKFNQFNFHQIPDNLNARAKALQLLLEVIYNGKSLQHLQNNSLEQLSPQDRGFVMELVLGCLRRKSFLNQCVNTLLTKPLRKREEWVGVLVEVGFYQLYFLKMPAHAVIHSMVELVKCLGFDQFSGLVNGLLRNLNRDIEDQAGGLAESLPPDHKGGLPQWLEGRIRTDWPDQWREIFQQMAKQPDIHLRVNRQAISYADYTDNPAIESQVIGDDQLKELSPWWVPLLKPQPIRQLPGYEAGEFSVQDVSAQLAVEVLLQVTQPTHQQANMRWLDACAAPGGKTSHLLEALPAKVQLDVRDSETGRLQRLQENLQRLKLLRNGVNIATADLRSIAEKYDVILLDAPCSGTGVIGRHPDIAWCRRATDIADLAELQLELLEHCEALLNPGGYLLFSTCSILKAENVDNCQKLLSRAKNSLAEVELNLLLGERQSCGYQRLPGLHLGDGFFYALFKKSTDS